MEITLKEDETLTPINDSLRLIQKKEGLTFGTDALLLAAFVKKPKNAVAVDLGSGTGVISLLCAARGSFKRIYACELQHEYADIIARNALLNGLDGVIEPIRGDIRRLELPGELPADIVFSNPPYMKAGGGFSSADPGRDAARRELNGDITDFCAAAAKTLRYGGDFYVVYRTDRLVDLLYALRAAGLEPKKLILVFADETHSPSLVLVSAKKGASPSLIIPKPLFLRMNGENSPEAVKIYRDGVIEL